MIGQGLSTKAVKKVNTRRRLIRDHINSVAVAEAADVAAANSDPAATESVEATEAVVVTGVVVEVEVAAVAEAAGVVEMAQQLEADLRMRTSTLRPISTTELSVSIEVDMDPALRNIVMPERIMKDLHSMNADKVKSQAMARRM